MRDPRKIIISHLLTEKYSELKEKDNTYVFQVNKSANKIEIKDAVEALFKVKVDTVRTINNRGKMKRLGRFVGKRPNWKKALVILAKGQSISQLDTL